MKSFILIIFFINIVGCSTDKEKMLAENEPFVELQDRAQVTSVGVEGNENAYTFEVTIASPDTGCDQYADWWEVIDLEGNLLYRLILAHSHVTEQPFARSGGTIDISEDTEVYVRAHMNNSGYVAQAQRGSVANGFQATELEPEFAQDLNQQEPLPDGCAF